MKRLLLVSLAAVLLGGCGPGDPSAVRLVGGSDPLQPEGSCFLSYGQGELIEDAEYGTAVRNANGVYWLTWPNGYTARRADGNIEVLDRDGAVVAVTGRTYRIFGRSWGDPPGPVFSAGRTCVLDITDEPPPVDE